MPDCSDLKDKYEKAKDKAERMRDKADYGQGPLRGCRRRFRLRKRNGLLPSQSYLPDGTLVPDTGAMRLPSGKGARQGALPGENVIKQSLA